MLYKQYSEINNTDLMFFFGKAGTEIKLSATFCPCRSASGPKGPPLFHIYLLLLYDKSLVQTGLYCFHDITIGRKPNARKTGDLLFDDIFMALRPRAIIFSHNVNVGRELCSKQECIFALFAYLPSFILNTYLISISITSFFGQSVMST